jgi:hypothetical protein
VEELFLRALLAGDELDVVEEQRIHGAVPVAERLHLVVADRGNELGHEGLGRHVDDFQIGPRLAELVADGLDQMGLAEAGAAVDEERVERAGGVFGDRLRGGVRELVGTADDERGEAVARAEDGVGELVFRRGDRNGEVVGGEGGVDDEMDLKTLGGDLVEDAANLGAETLPNLVDVALRRYGDIKGIPFLSQKPGLSKPGVILRPVNDLLDPAEHLQPCIHGKGIAAISLKIHSFSTVVEILGLVDRGTESSTRGAGGKGVFGGRQ